MVSLCTEGSGWAWQAWPIEASHVGVRQARCRGVWKRKVGQVRRGIVRQGKARQAGQGAARSSGAWFGGVWQVGHVGARHGTFRVWQGRYGLEWSGMAQQGSAGKAWRGRVRIG